jgi:hypothetical protein
VGWGAGGSGPVWFLGYRKRYREALGMLGRRIGVGGWKLGSLKKALASLRRLTEVGGCKVKAKVKRRLEIGDRRRVRWVKG